MISNLNRELSMAQKNRQSNSNNSDEISILNSQLIECSKQNNQLNSTLKKLTVREYYNYYNSVLVYLLSFFCLGRK